MKAFKPVVKILAQALAGQGFRNVDVGRGQNADIHFDHRPAAQARELLVLQDVQQLGLQQRRHLANFVEQDRAFVAQLEFARLGMVGAGKRAGFVTEQLALQQIGGHGRAIHLQESAMSARRQLVNQPRHYFLAGSAFSQHQYRNIHIGDQRRLRANLAHGRAGGHEKYVVVKLFDFAGKVLLVLAQTLINDRIQFSLLERFGQVIVRAQADGLHHLAGIADAGEHDDFHARHQSGATAPASAGRRFPASAGPAAPDRAAVPFPPAAGLLRRWRRFHRVVIHFEQGADVAQHSRFVINQ